MFGLPAILQPDPHPRMVEQIRDARARQIAAVDAGDEVEADRAGLVIDAVLDAWLKIRSAA